MTTPNTPTQREAIRSLIDRQDRAKQTAFVGRVKEYDRDTQTATIEPQHLEVFGPTEDVQPLPDLDNVRVLFPGGSGGSITWDLAAGDFILVQCTKYSLDVWRQRAEVTDPGDSRKFGLSGAIAHAVLMAPDSGVTDQVQADGMVIAAPKIYLTSKDAADALALASKVSDELDKIKTAYNTHIHDVLSADFGVTDVPSATYTPAPVDSKKVLAD